MSAAAKPDGDAAPEAGKGAAGKGGGKKKLIIVALAVLLLGGGGAGAWFSGALPKLLGKGAPTETEAEAAPPAHGAAAAPAHGAKPDGKAEAKGEGKGKTEAAAKGGPLFMDLPDITANLNAGPKRAVYVKLRTRLELSRPEDQATVQAAMPRVLDLFQGYLREMRPEELRGTASTYRLREELLARTNVAVAPARVVAVLFTDMIVQ